VQGGVARTEKSRILKVKKQEWSTKGGGQGKSARGPVKKTNLSRKGFIKSGRGLEGKKPMDRPLLKKGVSKTSTRGGCCSKR